MVAQGAAWIANDAKRLRLAKPLELQLARGSYLTVVKAGTEMPAEREVKRQQLHLYCTDPSDGVAKFQLCTPARPSARPQLSEPRSPLANLTVDVDRTANLFRERLELEVTIDDDLILTARAWSSEAGDEDTAEVHDLEFGLELPPTGEPLDSDEMPKVGPDLTHATGDLVVRAKLADTPDDDLVPGEVLYRHRRGSFNRHRGQTRATDEQVHEHLYYEPCAGCGRSSSDSACQCLTGRAGTVE